MKKLIYLPIIILLFINCGQKQDPVERIFEDGVEVVINHMDPYKVKGELSSLILEEEFSIDSEDENMLEIGLTQVQTFDVNSERNIFIMNSRSQDNILFEFTKNGKFVKSFIPRGQGPDEVELPFYFRINSNDEFVITDQGKVKLLIFDTNGKTLKTLPINSLSYRIVPLNNEKYLKLESLLDPSGDDLLLLFLCNSDLSELKELDKINTPSPFQGKESKGIPYGFAWSNSNNNIYVGNEERGYEIWVFDLEGKLIRRIRKEYNPVKVSEELKKDLLEQAPPEIKKLLKFPQDRPPFQYIVSDSEGKIFVMTYEKGNALREYVYDIFNKEGIFITRINLGNSADDRPLEVRIKNNYLYCLTEKESGYRKIVVYKMVWGK